jgi:hypothetical protein
MNRNLINYRNSIQAAGVIFGGLLISLPAIFQTAHAQQTNTITNLKLNPCPSIFYEEPHNNQVLVPQGCRPNAYTIRTNAQGINSGNNVGATPSPGQTQLGVGGEAPNNNTDTSQNYNSQYRNPSSMQQGTAVPSPQPLDYPNRGIPNSQIDPNTGNRINGPAGGYTNLRQSRQDSRNDSNNQYNNQSSVNSQVNTSNSSTNQAVPNSQIDPNSGNRINGPAGGYTNQRQLGTQSQINSTTGNRYQNAVATVSPSDGRVSVRLVNKTNAPIVYQVIGDTQLRSLGGRTEVMLQGLRTPANVAFYRQDRGLLMVTPQTSSRSGMLDVTLQETTDFAVDRTSMRIENNGAVYLN